MNLASETTLLMKTEERRGKMLVTGVILIAVGIAMVAAWIKGD